MSQTEIFNAAVRLSPAERSAFLDRACGDRREVRNEVESLLLAHDAPVSFLREPVERTAAYEAIAEQVGTLIGPYKLLEQIGEGGFGTVFMAEQTHPVRRKVALKVIKAGMDTRQVVARFEAERQALAVLDHPNIAKVFDGGETAGGRPYFVMELVRGLPVTEYCDQAHLTPRERLELFVQVCQAVQHAHQKGIIHRDIKPSNVLVSAHDGKPAVKVIDFGIAKAAGHQLTDKTLFTGFAQMIGTPLYMSPEQAGQSPDIDTRSDIYSLGVLLYELLTGSTPFSKERFRQAAFDEIRRIIREEEPPRPSTRLSDSTESLPSISAQRHTEPAKLTRLFRGEVDWIVMKALEKDRNRRYETANGFAADVQRYLNNETVQACPPSAGYRLRKFARRNRAVLAIVAGFTAVLVAGAAVSAWQAVRATGAERQARAETNRAEGEAEKARTEAAISQAINEFINRDLLARADPHVLYTRDSESQRELKLRTVLDRAAGRIEGRFQDQPMVEAALRQTIGYTYMQLDEDRLAEPHLRRAADLRREHLGPEHRDTLDSMFDLSEVRGDEGEMRRVFETGRRVLGADDPHTLHNMFSLALVVRKRGDYPGAIALIRDTLERYRRLFGEDSPYTAYTKHLLAHTLVMAGDAPGAGRAPHDAEIDRLYREALAVHRARYGFGIWQTWDIIVRRGEFLRSRGRFEEAEAVCREGYEGLQALPATPPEWSAVLATGLVETYRGWGKPALAAEWDRKQKAAQMAALVQKTGLLVERPDDIELLLAQAALYAELGRLGDAVAVCRKAVQIKPDSFEAHDQLAGALMKQAKWDESEVPFREMIRLKPNDAGLHHNFGDVFRAQKKFREAEAEYGEAFRLDPKYAEPHLADMLCREAGDYERGVPVLKELIKRKPAYAPTYALLGTAEARQGRWAEAAAAYRRATELAQDDHWNWFMSATLELSAGDTDSYRRVCRQMLERFGDTADPVVADRTAKACLLAPDAVADSNAVQKLAERSVTGTDKHEFYRWFVLTKALAEYRAGRHEDATRWLKKFDPDPAGGTPDATAFALQATARQHLSEAAEARKALSAAQKIMATNMPKTEKSGRFGDDWFNWLHAQFLCREAEKLLAE